MQVTSARSNETSASPCGEIALHLERGDIVSTLALVGRHGMPLSELWSHDELRNAAAKALASSYDPTSRVKARYIRDLFSPEHSEKLPEGWLRSFFDLNVPFDTLRAEAERITDAIMESLLSLQFKDHFSGSGNKGVTFDVLEGAEGLIKIPDLKVLLAPSLYIAHEKSNGALIDELRARSALCNGRIRRGFMDGCDFIVAQIFLPGPLNTVDGVAVRHAVREFSTHELTHRHFVFRPEFKGYEVEGRWQPPDKVEHWLRYLIADPEELAVTSIELGLAAKHSGLTFDKAKQQRLKDLFTFGDLSSLPAQERGGFSALYERYLQPVAVD